MKLIKFRRKFQKVDLRGRESSFVGYVGGDGCS